MKRLIFGVLVFLMVIGCATTQKTSVQSTKPSVSQPETPLKAVSTPGEVDQIKWILVGMKGFNLSTINYDSGLPSVQFDVNKSLVNGYSGCNSFGGNIDIKGDSLKFGMMMSTKKYCMGIPEPEFLNLLQSADSYEVTNGLLNLKSNGRIILTFSKASE
jgi:heat shock protein HslJ